MDTATPQDYVTIGHVCVDRLTTGDRLGGTVFFSAGQASTMGHHVRVVTACTAPTAAAARERLPEGTTLDLAPTDADTCFEFSAAAELGPQRLLSRASTITDVPAAADGAIWHLAPVFAELAPELIASARDRAAFVGATPQGLLRGTAADGSLTFEAERWPAGDFAHAIALNEDEYDHLAGIGLLDSFGGWVFRTLGPAGAALVRDGVEQCRVAPTPSDAEVPPQRTIGAGDVFAAAAFAALARGDAPERALAVAVGSASSWVRRPTDEPAFTDGSRAVATAPATGIGDE